MRFDFNEQIPEGMMDRVEQRLAAHLVVKKKKRTRNTLVLISVLALLVPATVYGFVNNNLQSLYNAIKIASDRGKSVKLNYDFEYGKNKIVFEDAVWEEDRLIVSYRVIDGVMFPAKFSLLNEKGDNVGYTGGSGFGMDGGTLEVNFDEEELIGEKVFLSIEGLERFRYSDEDNNYKYSFNLGKEFLNTGEAKVGKTFETEYGLITFEEIKVKDGRTFLTYSCDINEESKKSAGQDGNEIQKVNFIIKDKENNVLRSEIHPEPELPLTNEVELFGAIKNLDNPLELAIVSSQASVNWKVPIDIKISSGKVVELNRDVELESGTLRISEVVLRDASTKVKYEFTPAKGYENTIDVQPLIEISIGANKYTSHKRTGGEYEFPVGIDKKDMKKAVIIVHGIYRKEERTEKFTLSKEDVPTYFVVDGVKFNIEKMETRDGKTYMDIFVDRTKRKFTDFEILPARMKEDYCTVRTHTDNEFADKSIEPRYNDEPYSFDTSILETITIKKQMEISKAYDVLELQLEYLEYLDVCNAEIKLK